MLWTEIDSTKFRVDEPLEEVGFNRRMRSSTLMSAESNSAAVEAEPEVGLSHAWRALRHRNFRLFFGGQSVSLIGTLMAGRGAGGLGHSVGVARWDCDYNFGRGLLFFD